MKNSTSKILLAVFITITAFGKVKAQTNDIHAFFKGTETEVKSEINSKTLTFFVSGLSTDEQAAAFLKRSLPYSKSFTMNMGATANGQSECKINFVGTPDVKWMLRFFLASSVKDVEQNNSKKSPNDFFKTYM